MRSLSAVILMFALSSGVVAQNEPARSAEAEALEQLATRGWSQNILMLNTQVQEAKGKFEKEDYDMLVSAEYRTLFFCWIVCDGPTALIKKPENQKILRHWVKQAYLRMIKDSSQPDDPFSIFVDGEDKADARLKAVEHEIVKGAVPIPQLASSAAYRATVVRFREECAKK